MTTSTTVPFSALVAVDEINARGKTTEALAELAASIAAKGLIQPLAVRPADGGASGKGAQRYEIIDGRRRHQAMALLVKNKTWARSEPVPVLIRDEDDAEALETSLMANMVRLPMHPVDQHEVFARLAGDNVQPAEIAARFGIAERTVRQHMALGRLAPEVRAAWRKGRIDAETARAFAVNRDQGRQAAALTKLGGRINAWSVSRELAPRRVRADQSDELALIGEDAYLEAGGSIDEDLFDDARYIDDPALLERMARDRLLTKCGWLTADGWAWAKIEGDADFNAWECGHVLGEDQEDETDETYPFTADDKARSGCLVSIGWDDDGNAIVAVQTGLIRPSHASADGEGADDDDDQSDLEDFTSCVAPGDSAGAEPAAGRGDPDADGTPDQARSISAALIEDLTTQQTIVAQRVLADDPCLALAALIATLASYAHGGSPMQISESGYREGARPYDRKATFAARFDLCPIASTEALVETLAPLLAAALDLRSYNPAADRRNVGALVGRMDAETYLREMRKVFAAADYFARVPKALCIAALEDMHDGGHFFGLPGRDDLERMKKAELAPWAAEQAQACGWLPEMLRHPAYEIITRPAAGAAQAESTDATTGAAA